jgi:FtsZ-binding cell division protein ZapB
MTRPFAMLTSLARNRSLICLLTLWLLSSTFCSTSFAEARLTPDGEVAMSVEDARLLLGEVKALRAQNEALRDALASERQDVDRLIENTNALIQAMEAERKTWQDRLDAEKRRSRRNGLTMLLVGLVVGGII